MLTTGQTASRIAMALGYANVGAFTAAFRRVYGTWPSAWLARRL
ncbi:helix-turn-helix domain-containing protein [uncultured Sphingomonas sp.]